jgi:hypothetical protein
LLYLVSEIFSSCFKYVFVNPVPKYIFLLILECHF